MSTLQQAAHAALTSFCRNATSLRTDDSNDVDIYRTLRDVSTLLYETQLVRDMFDSDPFGLTWRMNDDDEEAKDENDEDDYEDKNKDFTYQTEDYCFVEFITEINDINRSFLLAALIIIDYRYFNTRKSFIIK